MRNEKNKIHRAMYMYSLIIGCVFFCAPPLYAKDARGMGNGVDKEESMAAEPGKKVEDSPVPPETRGSVPPKAKVQDSPKKKPADQVKESMKESGEKEEAGEAMELDYIDEDLEE